jgi:hypothetical protein
VQPADDADVRAALRRQRLAAGQRALDAGAVLAVDEPPLAPFSVVTAVPALSSS